MKQNIARIDLVDHVAALRAVNDLYGAVQSARPFPHQGAAHRAFREQPVAKKAGTCSFGAPPGISASRLLPSSSGQDAALSRLKQGFDSPWERH
jgi:hypothetical protein